MRVTKIPAKNPEVFGLEDAAGVGLAKIAEFEVGRLVRMRTTFAPREQTIDDGLAKAHEFGG